MPRAHVTSALERELASAALRKDGPLIDVELRATCEDQTPCRPIRGKALIDTGADRSAIELSELEGALPSGTYWAQGVTSEAIELPVYSLDMGFPGTDLESVRVENAAGTPHLRSQGIVALLGRDVLEHGVLTHDGLRGTFSLTMPGGSTEVRAPSWRLAGIAGTALLLGIAGTLILLPATR